MESFFYQHAVPDGTQKLRQIELHPIRRNKNRQAMQIFKVLNIFFIFSSFFSLRKNAMPACFDHPNTEGVQCG
jgi:hypothetical protein